MGREKITITKRKAKGVLADMIANMDEDSLAKTREKMEMIEMITEDYCSFEVSKLLEEKGFREYCGAIYFILENGDYRWSKIDIPIRDCSTCKPTAILCPTHQMAMKWLRQEGYSIIIDCHISEPGMGVFYKYSFLIKHYNFPSGITDSNVYSKYEQAVEAALKYSLENLI